MSLGQIQLGRVERFRENHSVAVGIGAVRTSIYQFTVPPKCRCRMLSFGNYLGTVAAWGVAYWEVLVQGHVIEFYGGTPLVMDQVGFAAQRQVSTEYEFSGGTMINFTGSNPTAAILNMGVSFEYELIYQE